MLYTTFIIPVALSNKYASLLFIHKDCIQLHKRNGEPEQQIFNVSAYNFITIMKSYAYFYTVSFVPTQRVM